MARIGLLLLFLLIALVDSGCIRGTRADPPKYENVSGVWIGQVDDAFNTLIRLRLDRDGTGLMACTNGSRNPREYEVVSWRLNGWDMLCELRPVSPEGDLMPIRLTAIAYGPSHLAGKVEYREKEVSWNRLPTVRFRPEKALLADLTRLTDTMEQPNMKNE